MRSNIGLHTLGLHAAEAAAERSAGQIEVLREWLFSMTYQWTQREWTMQAYEPKTPQWALVQVMVFLIINICVLRNLASGFFFCPHFFLTIEGYP